jgi:serine/threonine-protein kinase HipA
MEKPIYVYENWSSLTPVLIGIFYVNKTRGSETYSFEYDESWLKSSDMRFPLDPDLELYSGRQYPPADKNLFGLFSDSCPDRWGRQLMQRRELIVARKEGRKGKKLCESDYLLGVYDAGRMGALRFSLEEGATFESSDESLATPPWDTLRKLESASIAYENDESGSEDKKWLKQLVAPGSSLGGARPKATVQDVDGSLWIAKFPSKHDETNSGAWEMTVHELARLCGLNVPDAKLETFSEHGATFIVKRFDRVGERRIHFSSAMTLLGQNDGNTSSSYLDMVDFIKTNGACPQSDLIELWKRVVFNMAVTNSDDHLRNHGFLLTNTGWKLSPLYDVNPVPYGDALSLNVSMDDNSIDIGLAMETAAFYDISRKDAKKFAQEILITIKNNWEEIARKNGLSHAAINYMRPAFALCEQKI